MILRLSVLLIYLFGYEEGYRGEGATWAYYEQVTGRREDEMARFVTVCVILVLLTEFCTAHLETIDFFVSFFPNFFTDDTLYLKFNFLSIKTKWTSVGLIIIPFEHSCSSVCWLVGRPIGRSFIISYRAGELSILLSEHLFSCISHLILLIEILSAFKINI